MAIEAQERCNVIHLQLSQLLSHAIEDEGPRSARHWFSIGGAHGGAGCWPDRHRLYGQMPCAAWNAVASTFGDVERPRLVALAEASADLARSKAAEFGFAARRATGAI